MISPQDQFGLLPSLSELQGMSSAWHSLDECLVNNNVEAYGEEPLAQRTFCMYTRIVLLRTYLSVYCRYWYEWNCSI